MNSQATITQSYQKMTKKFKSFAMFGQFTIFIIRILAQRIFSVYIGIVLFQFILSTQMNFRTYCVVQSKFYLLLNCILFYLLTINFIESQINNSQTIQTVLKDKYIIDYVKIGYPIEFLFRFLATMLIWRVYQFSRMKTTEYGDVEDSEQMEVHTQHMDRIHVRENAHEENFQWGFQRNDSQRETQRNLRNSNQNSQASSLPNTHLGRQVSNRSNRSSQLQILPRRITGSFYRGNLVHYVPNHQDNPSNLTQNDRSQLNAGQDSHQHVHHQPLRPSGVHVTFQFGNQQHLGNQQQNAPIPQINNAIQPQHRL